MILFYFFFQNDGRSRRPDKIRLRENQLSGQIKGSQPAIVAVMMLVSKAFNYALSKSSPVVYNSPLKTAGIKFVSIHRRKSKCDILSILAM